MKLRILFIGLIVGVLVSCNSNPNQPKKKDLETKETQITKEATPITKGTSKNYVIANKTAGDFKIGNEIVFPSVNDTYKVEKEVLTKMVEGSAEEETVYTVSIDDKKLLLLKVVTDFETGEATKIIKEILVYSEKFKTSEGIGVSSTIEEFIIKYPTYKIWYTYVSDMYVLETESVNAQFLLDKNDFTSELKITSDQEFLKKTDFKSTAKIVKIRIY